MIDITMVDTSELWCFGRRLQPLECTYIFKGTLNFTMRYTCVSHVNITTTTYNNVFISCIFYIRVQM